MQRTRVLPLAGLVLGALALSGCIIAPPTTPDAPQTTAPTTPATSSPATSAPTTSEPAESEPADDGAGGSDQSSSTPTGSTVTIDGQDVGQWGGTVSCANLSGTALIAASTDDQTSGLFGSASDESGSWIASSFLVNTGDESYVQSDDAPATLEGGTFSTEFTASDFGGGSVTIAITAPC